MLGIDTYVKEILNIEIETNPITLVDLEEAKCWLCDKDFKSTKFCSKCNKFGDTHIVCRKNMFLKDHSHLTGKIRVLAHNLCNFKTRKAHSSFAPILFQNFSR